MKRSSDKREKGVGGYQCALQARTHMNQTRRITIEIYYLMMIKALCGDEQRESMSRDHHFLINLYILSLPSAALWSSSILESVIYYRKKTHTNEMVIHLLNCRKKKRSDSVVASWNFTLYVIFLFENENVSGISRAYNYWTLHPTSEREKKVSEHFYFYLKSQVDVCLWWWREIIV